MPRPRRSVALVCIAVVAFAAFLPGAPAMELAIGEPRWVLLPDLAWVALHVPAASAFEQLQPLLSVRLSRAPPAVQQ